jgi:hypothetical protein
VNWLRLNWKALLLAIATAVGTLTADHTIAHRASDVVVRVLPFIPEAPLVPAADPAP